MNECYTSLELATEIEKRRFKLLKYLSAHFGHTTEYWMDVITDVQEAVLRRDINNVRKGRQGDNFIITMLRNRSIDINRYKKENYIGLYEFVKDNRLTLDDLGAECNVTMPGSNLKRFIDSVLTDDDYRSFIYLHYFFGFNYEDIADQFEVPIGSLKAWLHRARLIIQKELALRNIRSIDDAIKVFNI